jgi:hypothetical protein
MNTSVRLLLSGTTLAACALTELASAQPAPRQPPLARGPAYGLQQLPEMCGIAQRFTLTPRGELDGFLLANGTQVHLPPHLTTELAAAVRPGDPVTVRGYRSPSVPLVAAVEVTDSATNQTVTAASWLAPAATASWRASARRAADFAQWQGREVALRPRGRSQRGGFRGRHDHSSAAASGSSIAESARAGTDNRRGRLCTRHRLWPGH